MSQNNDDDDEAMRRIINTPIGTEPTKEEKENQRIEDENAARILNDIVEEGKNPDSK